MTSLTLRRFFCFNAATASASSSFSTSSKKKSLVFLGSPEVSFIYACKCIHKSECSILDLFQVSATVLDALFNASAEPNSSFEVLHENSEFSFSLFLYLNY